MKLSADPDTQLSGASPMPWVVERLGTTLVATCDAPLCQWGPGTQKIFAALLDAVSGGPETDRIVLCGQTAFAADVQFDGAGRVRQADILELVTALAQSKTPVVAAISGLASGAGLEAALACASRVAGPDARFEMPEAALGLLPINGGVTALAALVGLNAAADMMALGDVHSGASAAAIGLVDRCESGDLIQAVLAAPPPRLPDPACATPDRRGDWDADLVNLGKRLRHRAPGSVAHRALTQALELGLQHRAMRATRAIRQVAERCAASDQALALAYAWAARAEDARIRDRSSLDAALRWTLLREAIHTLDAGGSPDLIDRALVGFGFVDAPLAAADRIGLGVILDRCADTDGAWRIYSPTVDLMSGEGRLGVASGLGWYRYPRGDGVPQVDPSLDRILGDSALAQRLQRRPFTQDEVVARCLAAMVNGAFSLLGSGAAPSALALDGAWNRMGFPAWRGGLLFHADRWGLQTVISTVQAANASRPTLGPPADLLVDLAARGVAAAPWPPESARSQ
ncbi:enoyl-CoA hydratase/isomerase family protein [Phenylobacterium sp.]|uniref:enoyl-CoA hydratase/isomerase family protein n=1 Tax=Phenylobacterium sp. TaxID=1871053 RepID=UPI0025EE7242|nr:enoyl-CoA hydratase/isomerase family protein [Phenylobacterium sp.]